MTMDIIHDYEYYEAHAKDVKIENITSDGDNADILARLRDNDPEMTSFFVVNEIEVDDDEFDEFVVREGDHLGWLGYFIGKSATLEQIIISLSPDNINQNAFLEGLGHNRSINTLDFSKDLGESFQCLIPFLRNNDRLRNIKFNHFDFGLQSARNIALLLDQQSSLTYLDFEDFGFDDEEFSQIVIALRSQPQIEELGLTGYNIGRGGCVALGGTLERCLSLRRLDLRVFNHDNEVTGDEGLNALVTGLKHCHNLTSLSLNGIQITEEGSRSLSTLFQSDNCRLEQLSLNEINIDADAMAMLATGLASLPSLKRLNLWNTSIGEQGLQDLVGGLVDCNLEELGLSSNMLMESLSGLRSLGKLVRMTSNMRSLSLRDCSLTDVGLISFVEGMVNCCNLRELNLACNLLITANGLTSLMSLLRDEHCSLRTLNLYYYGTHLRDDWAVALANGLIGNKSMKTLRFDFSITSITARGWAAFSRLLCDTSSVNNTFLSNHTIEDIGDYGMKDTPQDIVQYLKWNELNNQAAAICKILDILI